MYIYLILLFAFFYSCSGLDEINQKYFKNGENGTLNCDGGSQWIKDGTVSISDDAHYEIGENKLIIHTFAYSDVGIYVCKDLGGAKVDEFNVQSAVNVTAFPSKSKNLVEGDELELKCKAIGVEEVEWKKDNETLVASDHIVFEAYNSIINGKIKIESLQFEDAGSYSCSAGSSTKYIIVRVKDKLAALYPFLGIVGEVIIFCGIIACYERKRAKKMAEEDQPEEAGHLTNSVDHKNNDDEVRQRK